jgi:hypothetical protein
MAEDAAANLMDDVAAVFEEQSALVRGTTNPLVKAALGTAPFAGGVASLLGDLAQKRIEVRLRKFLIALAERIRDAEDSLQGKIDTEFVASSEFAATLQAILEEAARTSDAKKEAYLRDFIVASALRRGPTRRGATSSCNT